MYNVRLCTFVQAVSTRLDDLDFVSMLTAFQRLSKLGIKNSEDSLVHGVPRKPSASIVKVCKFYSSDSRLEENVGPTSVPARADGALGLRFACH